MALVDLDGVVYRGQRAIDGSPAAIAATRAAGMRVAFITNNASRTPADTAEHLRLLDVAASAADVVTSAQAAASVVASRYGRGARVLAVGGPGLREALGEVGCALVGSADDAPAVVVQGFSSDLTYRDLAEAALAVQRGAAWVVTNRDLTLPSERGIQPGNGSLAGAVRAAAGRDPDAYAGKPEAPLFAEALRRTGARRPLVVGDRLDTDIEGALRAGVDVLLVLSGVSSGADVVQSPPERRPTYLGAGIAALGAAHPRPVASGDGWRCGGWVATVDGTAVVAERADMAADLAADVAADLPAEPLDLLRAVATAAWAAADAGTPVRSLRLPAEQAGAARAARLERLLEGADPSVG